MNIAIVSTNKDKYSETFIHNHLKLLPGTIHFLFDGYLPEKYSTDKGVNSFYFQKKAKWFNFKKNTSAGEKQALIKNIEKYLKEKLIDLIFCEYGPSGVELLPLSKNLNIPLIVHFHGYDAYRDDILNSYGKQYKTLFEHASAIIGVSKHMCAQLEKLGCPSSKVHFMPYGIDATIFFEEKTTQKEITFVSCGRFVPKKAPQLLLRAFSEVLKQLPSANLVMIGDGELFAECVLLSETLGIKQSVSFMGALGQKEIAAIYRRAQIFVQHSVTTTQNDSEGTPLAILESGSSGLPVIATRHGGIADVIIENETGFLVEEQDDKTMAEKMIFLAQRPELCESIGKKAAQGIRGKYDLETYTQQLWNLIQKTV